MYGCYFYGYFIVGIFTHAPPRGPNKLTERAVKNKQKIKQKQKRRDIVLEKYLIFPIINLLLGQRNRGILWKNT